MLAQTDKKFTEDVNSRLEFRQSKTREEPTEGRPVTHLLSQYAPKHDLILHPAQKFVKLLMDPKGTCDRLLVKKTPGSGKTAESLASAIPYIDLQVARHKAGEETGRVFVIGFTDQVFKTELLRFPALGYATAAEIQRMTNLESKGAQGLQLLKELRTSLRRRITDRNGRGFFEFLGYKALANRLFPDIDVETISAVDLLKGAENGTITINQKLLDRFSRDSLMICDEAHRCYNAESRNQWGVALTVILQRTTVKAMLLTATPMRTPQEITDVANLIRAHPDPSVNRVYTRDKLFKSTGAVKPSALPILKDAFQGRVCFLHDADPALFPSVNLLGVPLAATTSNIKQFAELYVTKCPATALQRHHYAIAARGILGMDAMFICDWVIPLPVESIKTKRYPSSEIITSTGKPNSWWLSCNSEELSNLGRNPSAESLTSSKFGLQWNSALGCLSGYGFFHRDNIKWYSAVYYALILDIRASVQGVFDGPTNLGESAGKQKGGSQTSAAPYPRKRLVYHSVVRNSGVLAITSLLLANGFCRHGESGGAETLCIHCGRERHEHSTTNGGIKAKLPASKSHSGRALAPVCEKFVPCRLITIYAAMDTSTIESSIRMYNSQFNISGEHVSVCVGSRMLCESRDFKGLREIFVTRVDNMSSCVQLYGRGIRKGSHKGLPITQRDISLYTYMITKIKGGKEPVWPPGITKGDNVYPQEEDVILKKNSEVHTLSSIERRYQNSLQSWNVVLELQRRVFHTIAVDAAVNYNINVPEERTNSSGIMSVIPYTPDAVMKLHVERSTHDANYLEGTISLIRHLIKQAFSSVMTCWSFKMLYNFIKDPRVRTSNGLTRLTKFDTSETSEMTFINALSDLLYNTSEKKGITQQLIKHNKTTDYYSRMTHTLDKRVIKPDGSQGVIVHCGTDLFALVAIDKSGSPQMTTHGPFRLRATHVPNRIDIDAYRRTLDPAVEFQINCKRFMEEWMSPDASDKSRLQQCTCMFGVGFRRQLVEMAITNEHHDGVTKKQCDEFNNQLIGLFDRLNLIAYESTAGNYKNRIKRYLDDQTGKGTTDISTRTASSSGTPVEIPWSITLSRKVEKPIGHWIGSTPRVLRGKVWRPLIAPIDEHGENNIIVGYFELNASGDIISKFKIRTPEHQVARHGDSRRVERGSVCQSRPRAELTKLAHSLKINIIDTSVLAICNKIMRKLMLNESQSTNTRWWYFADEERPLGT